jgi:hypothetical protein
MKPSLLLALGLCAASLLAGGCATENTRYGSNTYFMGGLMTIRKADYLPAPATGVQVDTTKWLGHGEPTGTSVSFFYDQVKYTEY